ncbi:MAG: SPRY domain-containing protein, partial [Candidatus Paceibacterota bacterium]
MISLSENNAQVRLENEPQGGSQSFPTSVLEPLPSVEPNPDLITLSNPLLEKISGLLQERSTSTDAFSFQSIAFHEVRWRTFKVLSILLLSPLSQHFFASWLRRHEDQQILALFMHFVEGAPLVSKLPLLERVQMQSRQQLFDSLAWTQHERASAPTTTSDTPEVAVKSQLKGRSVLGELLPYAPGVSTADRLPSKITDIWEHSACIFDADFRVIECVACNSEDSKQIDQLFTADVSYGPQVRHAYFELEIVELARKDRLCIGFCCPEKLGWRGDAFFSYDRKGKLNSSKDEDLVYPISVEKGNDETLVPTFTVGDIVGGLWNRDLGTISFTKNGIDLGPAFHDIPENVDLLPAFSILPSAMSVKVRINFGQTPFLFLIDQAVQRDPAELRMRADIAKKNRKAMRKAQQAALRLDFQDAANHVMEFTGCSVGEAIAALRQTGKNVQAAVALWYDGGVPAGVDEDFDSEESSEDESDSQAEPVTSSHAIHAESPATESSPAASASTAELNAEPHPTDLSSESGQPEPNETPESSSPANSTPEAAEPPVLPPEPAESSAPEPSAPCSDLQYSIETSQQFILQSCPSLYSATTPLQKHREAEMRRKTSSGDDQLLHQVQTRLLPFVEETVRDSGLSRGDLKLIIAQITGAAIMGNLAEVIQTAHEGCGGRYPVALIEQLLTSPVTQPLFEPLGISECQIGMSVRILPASLSGESGGEPDHGYASLCELVGCVKSIDLPSNRVTVRFYQPMLAQAHEISIEISKLQRITGSSLLGSDQFTTFVPDDPQDLLNSTIENQKSLAQLYARKIVLMTLSMPGEASALSPETIFSLASSSELILSYDPLLKLDADFLLEKSLELLSTSREFLSSNTVSITESNLSPAGGHAIRVDGAAYLDVLFSKAQTVLPASISVGIFGDASHSQILGTLSHVDHLMPLRVHQDVFWIQTQFDKSAANLKRDLRLRFTVTPVHPFMSALVRIIRHLGG